jgi:hypothetical protein
MKKILFFGLPLSGTIIRANAFIKSNPQYEYTFCDMFGINDKYEIETIFGEEIAEIRKTMKYTEIYKLNECPDIFDLVLALNDKFFQRVLDYHWVYYPNLVDKRVLNDVVGKVEGLTPFKTDGFSDDEIVFIKPRIGAGQHTDASDNISYKKHFYGHIKHLDLTHFAIQEFLYTPMVISVTLVSNGSEFRLVNFAEAYYATDENGKSLNTHVESRMRKIQGMKWAQKYIDLAKALLHEAHYDEIPGIFMVQFMREYDKIYVNDVNVRSSPAVDIAAQLGLINNRVHNTLGFMIGDNDLEDSTDISDYRCYLETHDGKILSPLVENPDKENRYLLRENKQSGIIRNDYFTFMEKIS